MMASSPVLCFFLLSLAAYAHGAEFISDKLVNYIRDNSDPDVIPQTSLDKPINLTLSMSLNNIRSVDFTTKDVELDAWLTFSWNNGLPFDPADFDGLRDVRVPVSSVWRPDMEVYNGKMTFTGNHFSNYAICASDGRTLWVPKVNIRASCDVSRFRIAFNTTCHVKMGSWTYTGQFISLGDTPDLDSSNYLSGSSFELLNTSAKKDTTTYACCPEEYQDVKFSFSFKRKI